MPLLHPQDIEQLLQNGRASLADPSRDLNHFPVLKLFTPDAGATWLLTELDPENPDIAFGLCDLGLGFPELGYVSISELEALRGPTGLPVERDEHFTPRRRINAYISSSQGRAID